MTPTQADQIKNLLKSTFSAEVEVEEVDSAKGRYQFDVISEKFNQLSHLKRQDAIWQSIDQAVTQGKLDPEAMLAISLIIAYAPDELHQQAS